MKRPRIIKSPGGDGMTVKMIRAGGREVARQIHKLILLQHWREETMPDEWKEAISIPLHKICTNRIDEITVECLY